ncbi:CHAP domain-containing protein [Nocardia sp. NPDC057440]|uniref:CHAP domain-containing protein n=1 Tax=Nocardia sp. NPDC057440 TaxID=3346134 RepID=UPI003671936D
MSPGPTIAYRPEETIPDVFEVDLPNELPGWPPPLVLLVNFIDENLQASVLNLAAGTPGTQPDAMDSLRKVDILAKSADGKPTSTLADDYEQKITKVDDIKKRLHAQNTSVDASAFATFDKSSTTFNSVMTKVRDLENNLRSSDGPKEPSPIISATTFRYILDQLFGTLSSVHDEIAMAVDDIQTEADRIHRSIPPGFPSYAAPSYGPRPTALAQPHSNGEYVPANPTDGVGNAVKAAWGELKRGVRETNGNNVVDAEYNINDAWCAAFATWAWGKGDIDVDWNNPNLVSSIWSQAQGGIEAQNGMGRVTTGPISTAGAGDLLIWGDQGHIGLVVARNGNMITTIEGNSSDQVAERTYDITKGGFAGVVHPPPGSKSSAVGSSAQAAM